MMRERPTGKMTRTRTANRMKRERINWGKVNKKAVVPISAAVSFVIAAPLAYLTISYSDSKGFSLITVLCVAGLGLAVVLLDRGLLKNGRLSPWPMFLTGLFTGMFVFLYLAFCFPPVFSPTTMAAIPTVQPAVSQSSSTPLSSVTLPQTDPDHTPTSEPTLKPSLTLTITSFPLTTPTPLAVNSWKVCTLEEDEMHSSGYELKGYYDPNDASATEKYSNSHMVNTGDAVVLGKCVIIDAVSTDGEYLRLTNDQDPNQVAIIRNKTGYLLYYYLWLKVDYIAIEKDILALFPKIDPSEMPRFR